MVALHSSGAVAFRSEWSLWLTSRIIIRLSEIWLQISKFIIALGTKRGKQSIENHLLKIKNKKNQNKTTELAMIGWCQHRSFNYLDNYTLTEITEAALLLCGLKLWIWKLSCSLRLGLSHSSPPAPWKWALALFCQQLPAAAGPADLVRDLTTVHLKKKCDTAILYSHETGMKQVYSQ